MLMRWIGSFYVVFHFLRGTVSPPIHVSISRRISKFESSGHATGPVWPSKSQCDAASTAMRPQHLTRVASGFNWRTAICSRFNIKNEKCGHVNAGNKMRTKGSVQLNALHDGAPPFLWWTCRAMPFISKTYANEEQVLCLPLFFPSSKSVLRAFPRSPMSMSNSMPNREGRRSKKINYLNGFRSEWKSF